MAIDTTIIGKPISFQNVEKITKSYKVVHLNLKDQVNLAGSGAGAVVSTPISIPNLPATYMVFVTANHTAVGSVNTKTTSGFNAVLSPSPSTLTVTAGTFDCLVVYEI